MDGKRQFQVEPFTLTLTRRMMVEFPIQPEQQETPAPILSLTLVGLAVSQAKFESKDTFSIEMNGLRFSV